MPKVKVKLNLAGFRELRTHPKTRVMIERKAAAVARAAGPGFEVDMHGSDNRAGATVYPATQEAWRQSATNPAALIGALDAARG